MYIGIQICLYKTKNFRKKIDNVFYSYLKMPEEGICLVRRQRPRQKRPQHLNRIQQYRQRPLQKRPQHLIRMQ